MPKHRSIWGSRASMFYKSPQDEFKLLEVFMGGKGEFESVDNVFGNSDEFIRV